MTEGAPQLHDDVQTLAAYARQRALSYPDRVAFSEAGRRISYGTLLIEAQALASGLWQIGLRPGDVISFQLPNWIETAIINLAANLLGVRCNPIVPIYRDSELLAILSAARTRCFFVPRVWGGCDYAAMARRLQSNLPELQVVATVRADQPGPHDYETLMAAGRGANRHTLSSNPTDDKLLMFTSGTSGRAKGVLHSQTSLVSPLMRACAKWPLREHDCMLMPSPVTHITGYCCGLEMPLFLGTRTVLMDKWNAASRRAIDSGRERAGNSRGDAVPEGAARCSRSGGHEPAESACLCMWRSSCAGAVDRACRSIAEWTGVPCLRHDRGAADYFRYRGRRPRHRSRHTPMAG